MPPNGKICDTLSLIEEKRIGQYEENPVALLFNSGKGCVELLRISGLKKI
jgi:hypothetical protein